MKYLIHAVIVAVFVSQPHAAVAEEFSYHIGCGSADITGPVVGVQFWGFVRADQIGNGLHLRQRARAFVVQHPESAQRLAIVVCDLGSITHELHREVVERLQKEFGDSYSLANVLLTATHTHAAPGGFWHAGVGTPFGSPLHRAYFDAIVEGIVSSVRQAHESLQPGSILVAQGEVPDAGANRSRVAYMNNPEEERARYDSNTDTTMTLLKFETASGPIGCINWFAVHPTTMTYNNKLVSGDNKGYAEVAFERELDVTYEKAGEFVAAFAQSNCGDVTGNLNLNNTGPGEDEFETTRIIGDRQKVIARELYDQATDRLTGEVGSRQAFVDFSSVEIDGRFTQGEPQSTADAAYGYAFAAGSTEDGGGHPLFREGMTQVAALLEMTLDQQFPDARPDDALRERHRPKAILIAPGNMKPQVGLSQVLSLTVAQIGSLAIVAGPAEFTTMAGRRIRDTVAEVLGTKSDQVVIAGYTNGYAGYVTTREEYQTQQYEGGHTLFGPWTLAAYQQEYARLAGALNNGGPAPASTGEIMDLRAMIDSTDLGTSADIVPEEAAFGDVESGPQKSYRRGETASATFWTSNPQNHYPHTISFCRVEQQSGDVWTVVASDADWSTRSKFKPGRNVSKPYRVTVTWDISADTSPGTYRLRHDGRHRPAEGAAPVAFSGLSEPFEVVE